ncbi:MAG: hypothetical protein RMJ56_01150 [Gemmataceae bacterium]|nr:hypothetical protein [Gemmata sp.]MDW8196188.1 hypothetical protein [Gemmataceae bacterium]
MGRYLLGLMAFGLLVGCNRFSGPLETRRWERPDAPSPDGVPYTIYEQQKRGRERLAISEDDFRIGPKAYIDRPSPIGR